MILFESNSILLGGIPESIGLLLFGIALVAVTVGVRRFMREDAEQEVAQEPMKNLVQNSQTNQDIAAENLVFENK